VSDEVDPREVERIRRRDHDANAERRDLMRPGMGKVFKQILDAQVKAASDPLPRLRALCMAHPGVTERMSHGEPGWFIGTRKAFVTYAARHHDDRVAFWCAAPPGAQETLVEAEPERFFVPPDVGHPGWLGVWVDVPVSWDEISRIVGDAYRTVAGR
jgi:hypothetical protein